ncbi:AraC family ligand binding domain-containing protein [Paenibacillus sp. E194]|uniref:AraC family ligand binding domain-containing protein n=1 Tax=Paenibacillus sp. E194 TaxID=1458845 RepID=UPI001E2B79B7|nr:AraC family ligand binding domain-containing protein [Paenibacillus sp. E194]
MNKRNHSSSRISWNKAIYKLRTAEYRKDVQGYQSAQQWTSTHLLIITTQGHGTVQLDKKEYSLSRECAYWFAPAHTFGMKSEAEDGIEAYLFISICIEKQRREHCFIPCMTNGNSNIRRQLR